MDPRGRGGGQYVTLDQPIDSLFGNGAEETPAALAAALAPPVAAGHFDELRGSVSPANPGVLAPPWSRFFDNLGREGFADLVPVSALTGENLDRLERVLLSHLPEGDPIYPEDYLTDQPERFFVAELVREQVLQQTHDELPFSTAVVVDKFEEADAKGLMRFYCTILVERETQKPILVGRAGARIKAIGTAARKELERFFDARVFLDLHVKVREGWREDERMLDSLGLPSKKRR